MALYVLSYLDPKDLLKAAQTCRSWRFLSEDNLLWREKCQKTGIPLMDQSTTKCSRNPYTTSPWKVCFTNINSRIFFIYKISL